MKRRNFLKSSLTGLSMIGLPQVGTKAAAPSFSDYKALVYINLAGGNDAWNSFIPASGSGNSQWTVYNNGRGDLSVANTDMTLPSIGTLSQGTGNPYYSSGGDSVSYLSGAYPLTGISEVRVNAMMPELARLLEDGKISLIGDIGTLVEPLNNGKTDYQNASKKKPAFLFAHNHQTRVIQTGKADDLNATGWTGRLADLWSGINSGSVMGLNVSFNGQVRLMTGVQSKPVLFSTGNTISYSGLDNDGNSLKTSRRTLFKSLYGSNPGNDPFSSVYNRMLKNSLELDDLLAIYWNSTHKTSFSSKGSYGESLFSIPSKTYTGMEDELEGDLIQQLEAVAQLIYLGSSKMSFNRQVFFVHFGSFDTHGNQAEEHPVLLRELSVALWKFQKGLEEMELDDKVATFTHSDFGRTIGNNGDGTDHAWSTINLVMSKSSGTSFNGGKFYGSLPNLTMGGADDIKDGGKGRFVPKLSVDQMNATLCSWFGVPDANMITLFPNLHNFKTGTEISSAYLKLSGTNLI